jgi:hypothetical protein
VELLVGGGGGGGGGADESRGEAADCELDADVALSGLNMLVNIWFGVGWQEGVG